MLIWRSSATYLIAEFANLALGQRLAAEQSLDLLVKHAEPLCVE